MDYATFNLTVETHIDANYSETEVKYANAPVPSSVTKEYVTATIILEQGLPRAMGSVAEWRQWGHVAFQIFIPPNQGSRRAWQIADIILPMISNQTIGDGQFLQAYAQEAGARDGYFQVNVWARFYRRVS